MTSHVDMDLQQVLWMKIVYINSLLGARMAALDATEPPPEPKFDEYMYTFCTA